MSDLIDCPVVFHEGVSRFGVFANAFRVVPDAGQECFLDFCVYSAQEDRAEVIARIRVHRSFIPILQERFSVLLTELVGDSVTFTVKDGTLQAPDGTVVLFDPMGTDEA